MTFAAFSSWIVTLIAAILVSFLRAFVIVDLIDLFNVPYFYAFDVVHVWALLAVLLIASSSSKKNEDEDRSWDDTLKELWFKMFEKIFFVLASWGLAYLVSYFVL